MGLLGSLGQAKVSSQQAWQLVQLWLPQQQLLDPQGRVALQLQQADGHGVLRRSGNLVSQGLLHLQARTGSQDTLQLSQGIPQASTASQGRSGSNKRSAPCLLPNARPAVRCLSTCSSTSTACLLSMMAGEHMLAAAQGGFSQQMLNIMHSCRARLQMPWMSAVSWQPTLASSRQRAQGSLQ